MKKGKIMITVLILSLLLFNTFSFSVGADTVKNVDPLTKKTSDKLDIVLDNSGDNDIVSVWIWLKDINPSLIDEEIIKQTRDDYIHLSSISGQHNPSDNEKNNTFQETFQRDRIRITKEIYENHNNEALSILGIESSNIIFKSKLTPSAIVNATKLQIISFVNNSIVESIDYYEQYSYREQLSYVEQPPNREITNNTDVNSMHIDLALDNFGCTGDGINILTSDLDYVRTEYVDPNCNFSNVYNVINENAYIYSNSSVLPTGNYNSHGTYIAGVLKEFSPNATVYALQREEFDDIEWAIEHCYIDIINASINFGTPTSYFIDGFSRWYDGLVNSTGIPVIASAGNTVTETNINVISPGNSYNSIAVGAYETYNNPNQDIMRNFRYNDNTNPLLPTYKPDVVVAAYDTSTAAARLSGIVSWMLELQPSLKKKPEIIKAIVLASCHRKVLPFDVDDPIESIADGLTLKQGAGAVDAYRALMITNSETYGSCLVSNSNNNTVNINLLVLNGNNHSLQYNDNLNVSIAWLKKNSFPHSPYLSIDPGTPQDIFLEIQNSNEELIASSSAENSGKQMAYALNLDSDETYKININKNTINDEGVLVGYAWSERGIKELDNGSINGRTAIGETVNTIVYADDNSICTENELSFVWKRSYDGIIWNTVLGECTSSYTITNNDFGAYLKCLVIPCDSSMISITPFEITSSTYVVRFGDVSIDNNVTQFDLTLLQNYLASFIDFDDSQLVAADINLDDEVDSIDATWLSRYLADNSIGLPIYE